MSPGLNLDYFGARYYAWAMGRFTSPDQPLLDQYPVDPQSWNLYHCVRNNPLRFVDPNGEYVASCSSDVKGCQNEIEAVEKTRQQALQSKDLSVRRAAEAYGDLGDDNGVSLTIAKTVDPKHKSVAGQVGAQQGTGGFTVDAEGNIKQATAVTLKAGLSGNALTGTVVHEGSHVADRADFVKSIHRDPQSAFGFSYDPALNITRGQSEINAYGIENVFLQSVGLPQRNIKRILRRPPYSTTDLSLPLFPAPRVQP